MSLAFISWALAGLLIAEVEPSPGSPAAVNPALANLMLKAFVLAFVAGPFLALLASYPRQPGVGEPVKLLATGRAAVTWKCGDSWATSLIPNNQLPGTLPLVGSWMVLLADGKYHPTEPPEDEKTVDATCRELA